MGAWNNDGDPRPPPRLSDQRPNADRNAAAQEIADQTFVATEGARAVLVERIEAALDRARQEGRREGLEEAARWHDRAAESMALSPPSSGGSARHGYYAEHIRALATGKE